MDVIITVAAFVILCMLIPHGSSASIRGGFFKALNEYYGKEQSFNLRRPRSAASSQQLDEA
eukprot:2523978-Amphidinium_carterae.1